MTYTMTLEKSDYYKDPSTLLQMFSERVTQAGPDHARMALVSSVVDGDIVVPLPEMHKHEKTAVPNLSQQGLDQLARRISSVMPVVNFPSLRASDLSDKQADFRNKVTLGWWAENRMRKVLGRRARWYLGYATAPVIIKPSVKGIPRWLPRHPRDVFPSDLDIDEYTPVDCFYRSFHTYRWLINNYPEQALRIRKPDGWDPNDASSLETVFTVLEYNSADEDTLLCIGYDEQAYHDPQAQGSDIQVLSRVPNRAGIPWGVIPGRITLNKRVGHFDSILGMYQAMAELMAMQLIATKRGIWPREWLVANPGETPKIMSIPDPASGRPGVLRGGKLEQQPIDSAFEALNVIHELEASQRSTAGLPPELGGQSSTNIRTGRRGAQVLGAAIDFTIEEANYIFAESLYEENRRAIAIDKAYFNEPKTYHVITRGFQGEIDYTPEKLWETDKHVVDYPFAGVDLQNLPVEGGQRVAMETMSRETFMEMDPAVPDVPGEKARIWIQGARDAWQESFKTQAALPDGPYRPEDISAIIKHIRSGLTPEDALEKYNKELQELQEQAQQGELAPEELQPGLAPPGAPGELPAAIPEATPSLSNMQGLLSRMATTQTAQRYR